MGGWNWKIPKKIRFQVYLLRQIPGAWRCVNFWSPKKNHMETCLRWCRVRLCRCFLSKMVNLNRYHLNETPDAAAPPSNAALAPPSSAAAIPSNAPEFSEAMRQKISRSMTYVRQLPRWFLQENAWMPTSTVCWSLILRSMGCWPCCSA